MTPKNDERPEIGQRVEILDGTLDNRTLKPKTGTVVDNYEKVPTYFESFGTIRVKLDDGRSREIRADRLRTLEG